MTATASKTMDSDSRRSAGDLLERLTDIRDILVSSLPNDEETGHISQRSYDALDRNGFFGMLAPCEFGGDDLGPVDAFRVLEDLSRIDMSIAWTVMVYNSHLKELQFLDKDVAATLCARGLPHIAGQGAPTGRAERVQGGFRVTGSWSYASGLSFADTVSSAAIVMRDGQPVMTPAGGPETILFLTPIDTVSRAGNWDVLGLRASGSEDYTMHDVFVPDAMVCRDFFNATELWGGPSARLTFTGWLLWDHTAVELGAGRTVLDQAITYACTPTAKRGRLADSPVFQTELARREAHFRSARAWVYDVWDGIEQVISSDQPVHREQLTDARAAMLHLHETNADNATWSFRQCGGSSLRAGDRQRFYRDILAAGQHILASTTAWKDCGRDYAHEADGMRWSIYNLV